MSVNEVQGVLIHEPYTPDICHDDRGNVSALHRQLQHRAVKWASNRLFPCFGSVEISMKHVQCDALVVGVPLPRLGEATRRDEVVGLMPQGAAVILFEAKATKQDFLATFGPKARPRSAVGNLRFLVKPRAVDVPLDLLPQEWGVLEAYGSGLSVKRRANIIPLQYQEDVFLAVCKIVTLSEWGKRSLRVPCPDCAEATGCPLPRVVAGDSRRLN